MSKCLTSELTPEELTMFRERYSGEAPNNPDVIRTMLARNHQILPKYREDTRELIFGGKRSNYSDGYLFTLAPELPIPDFSSLNCCGWYTHSNHLCAFVHCDNTCFFYDGIYENIEYIQTGVHYQRKLEQASDGKPVRKATMEKLQITKLFELPEVLSITIYDNIMIRKLYGIFYCSNGTCNIGIISDRFERYYIKNQIEKVVMCDQGLVLIKNKSVRKILFENHQTHLVWKVRTGERKMSVNIHCKFFYLDSRGILNGVIHGEKSTYSKLGSIINLKSTQDNGGYLFVTNSDNKNIAIALNKFNVVWSQIHYHLPDLRDPIE
ncbi:Hypothetical protein HVR_LOCUS802 [uncultured virus]|nr:Hypothetical protein HVR_LOCUS802 [uncultured virus]